MTDAARAEGPVAARPAAEVVERVVETAPKEVIAAAILDEVERLF